MIGILSPSFASTCYSIQSHPKESGQHRSCESKVEPWQNLLRRTSFSSNMNTYSVDIQNHTKPCQEEGAQKCCL